ncbi:MAG: hypothetical protein SGARI_001420, partial [Bacillariaceae sp.]
MSPYKPDHACFRPYGMPRHSFQLPVTPSLLKKVEKKGKGETSHILHAILCLFAEGKLISYCTIRAINEEIRQSSWACFLEKHNVPRAQSRKFLHRVGESQRMHLIVSEAVAGFEAAREEIDLLVAKDATLATKEERQQESYRILVFSCHRLTCLLTTLDEHTDGTTNISPFKAFFELKCFVKLSDKLAKELLENHFVYMHGEKHRLPGLRCFTGPGGASMCLVDHGWSFVKATGQYWREYRSEQNLQMTLDNFIRVLHNPRNATGVLRAS